MRARDLDALNRGPFPVGPPPKFGERCPRCHITNRCPSCPPCLVCKPKPLWEIAARNLAAAYRPEGIP